MAPFTTHRHTTHIPRYVQDTLASRGTTEAWKTAVLYHLVHSVALIALPPSAGEWTATLWTAGIALFSGSIYGMSTCAALHWPVPTRAVNGAP